MKSTIQKPEPVAAIVTVEMTEDEAIVLRKFAGSPGRVPTWMKDVTTNLYWALQKVVPQDRAYISSEDWR